MTGWAENEGGALLARLIGDAFARAADAPTQPARFAESEHGGSPLHDWQSVPAWAPGEERRAKCARCGLVLAFMDDYEAECSAAHTEETDATGSMTNQG